MVGLSTGDKILIAMFEFSHGTSKPMKYEDIVVATWKKFPQDFSLRGYEYPDSSDIHKPLYGPLKARGYVRNANKFFSLTERGLSHARDISEWSKKAGPKKNIDRMKRDEKAEIDRLMQSDAFRFFEKGEREKILDTDLYAFYGVTVRTGKNEFIGRINTVKEAIINAGRIFPDNAQFQILADLHVYLSEDSKFNDVRPE